MSDLAPLGTTGGTRKVFCWECWRMVVATVVGELVVAGILWALR